MTVIFTISWLVKAPICHGGHGSLLVQRIRHALSVIQSRKQDALSPSLHRIGTTASQIVITDVSEIQMILRRPP